MYINDVTIILQKAQGPKINHPWHGANILINPVFNEI